MSFLWTWVGAAFGLAFGHSLGALILGALIGWVVDTMFHQRRRLRAQRQFVAPLFAVLGALAKADGRVSQAEIGVAERMMQRFDLDATQRAEAIARFNAGKQAGFQLAPALAELRRICAPQPQLAWAVLDVLAEVAYAEGAASPPGFQLLQQAAHALGFGDMQLLALLMMRGYAMPQGAAGAWQQQGYQQAYQRGSRQSPASRSSGPDPYAVLGVERSSDDASIKRAYRKLISQYHPDRLGDLPEELRRRAERRASEINTAWEAIKGERGIV